MANSIRLFTSVPSNALNGRNKKIQGLHSWIRFYLEEKNDYINYLGYITNISLGTVSYSQINRYTNLI